MHASGTQLVTFSGISIIGDFLQTYDPYSLSISQPDVFQNVASRRETFSFIQGKYGAGGAVPE